MHELTENLGIDGLSPKEWAIVDKHITDWVKVKAETLKYYRSKAMVDNVLGVTDESLKDTVTELLDFVRLKYNITNDNFSCPIMCKLAKHLKEE